MCALYLDILLSADLFLYKGNEVRDPKSITTIRKLPHHVRAPDNVSLGIKSLLLQLYYQQVALVIEEEFYKRNVLWGKAYVLAIFFQI